MTKTPCITFLPNTAYLTASTASLTRGKREILRAITLPGGNESK